MRVFPHDMVYDSGFATGKAAVESLTRMEIKEAFAFRIFTEGILCEKVTKYIRESMDIMVQLERGWKSQPESSPEHLEIERSE